MRHRSEPQTNGTSALQAETEPRSSYADRRGRRPQSAPQAQSRCGDRGADRPDPGGRSHPDGRQDRRSRSGVAPFGLPLLRRPERPRSHGDRNRVPQDLATLRDPERRRGTAGRAHRCARRPRRSAPSSGLTCSASSPGRERSISTRSIADSTTIYELRLDQVRRHFAPELDQPWTSRAPRRSLLLSPQRRASTATTSSTGWSSRPVERDRRDVADHDPHALSADDTGSGRRTGPITSRRSSGRSSTARTSAFQADDAGSIPVVRSTRKSLVREFLARNCVTPSGLSGHSVPRRA